MDTTTVTRPAGEQTTRNAGITAGIGLLLMAPLSVFGILVAGDAAQTAEDIRASEGLFRLGIASLFVVVVLDVLVAWTLYHVFTPVSARLSLLAAWLRIVYAGVFLVAVSQLVAVLGLLGDDGRAALGADQRATQVLLQVSAFSDIHGAGLTLFGFHLLVLGYLAYRSGYVPKLLGVLLGVAGFGYTFDGLVAVLVPSPAIELGMVTFIGELLLALWLVFRGRRLTSRL